MGAYCTCETSALDKENLIQYEFGEKEKILSEIKPKLKNFNNAEFISKEEFDKILSSFPNVNELISQFEEKTRQETEQKEDLQTPDTNPPSGRVSHQGTNLIENIEPIKFFGDDEQFTIYNFNIDKDYNFIGKGYQITNNFIYYGYIENNLSNGKGILINKNGSSLFGDWENGQCTGKGTLIIKNILEYDGDFVKNKKEGYGVEKYSDGSTYEGYFQDDKKNGKGKCLLKNGEIYEGEFLRELLMEKELINLVMEVFMTDFIRKELNMVVENILGLMEKYVRVIGLIINYMGMQFLKKEIKYIILLLDLGKLFPLVKPLMKIKL